MAQAAAAQTIVDIDRRPDFQKAFEQKTNAIGCSVHAMPPRLDFGFHFVSGYYANVPLRRYEGPGHSFGVIMRVTADGAGQSAPVYFFQLFKLPVIPPRNKSELELGGGFELGPGGYKVEWLLLDGDGAVCRKTWYVEAKLANSERDVQVVLPRGAIRAVGDSRGRREIAAKADANRPVRLTVYLHVAPLSMRRFNLRAYDRILLLSSLQSLLERVAVTDVRVVAFNLDQQKEMFRDDHFNAKSWGKLDSSVSDLKLSTVPISVLQRKTGYLDLLSSFLNDELTGEETRDVVIFMGPTARQDQKIRLEATARRGTRFYYLQYKPFWARGQEVPDVISRSLRPLNGKTYFIYSPHEFVQALRDITQAVNQASGPG